MGFCPAHPVARPRPRPRCRRRLRPRRRHAPDCCRSRRTGPTPALIATNDRWTGVPGFQGFLGQGITGATGADPQLLLGTSAEANDLDVNANQTDPNTFATGGVAEFASPIRPSRLTARDGRRALHPARAQHDRPVGDPRELHAPRPRRFADNAIQPVALQFRVGSTGPFTNVPAGFVADATTGPSLADLVTPVSVVLPAAADDQPRAAGPHHHHQRRRQRRMGRHRRHHGDGRRRPAAAPLSVTDVSVTEGDTRARDRAVLVRLTSPAGPGGVTFDVATADGSAPSADDDYVPLALAGQTIAEGASEAAVDVTVNGDTAIEPNEASSSWSATSPAPTWPTTPAPARSTTTTSADPIHDIQGPGATSPIVGATRDHARHRHRRQEQRLLPPGRRTPRPTPTRRPRRASSSSPAPRLPPAAVVGALLQVTGTVTEFMPGADPLQPPLTEIAGADDRASCRPATAAGADRH